ncbi:MAG: hemolysin III family protein [Firmicutes bacterium]|nr:hemolysin III family protein [Bacillota bacterium]
MTIRNRKEGALYSISEEIANAISHGIGAFLSVLGLIILLMDAIPQHDVWKIVSVSIYGASMITLFSMSTMYHSLTHKKAKKVFRIFDHTSISILIAGTYTPFTLVLLRGTMGWIIFGVVWTASIVNIVLNSISINKFKTVSMISYVASGWVAVFAIVPIIKTMPALGIILLFLGGIMYTGGLIFYRKKNIKYMHFIWHLFVLAGAILHFFCILFYVI